MKTFIVLFFTIVGLVIGLTMSKKYVYKPVSGTIKEKVHSYSEHKHNYVDNPTIIFQPDVVGCVMVIYPSNDLFYNHSVGDKITFMINYNDVQSNPCKIQFIDFYKLDEKEYHPIGFVMAILCGLFGCFIGLAIIYNPFYKI